jgi:hypothetical protein
MAFRSASKATIAFGEEFLYELKADLRAATTRRPPGMVLTLSEP